MGHDTIAGPRAGTASDPFPFFPNTRVTFGIPREAGTVTATLMHSGGVRYDVRADRDGRTVADLKPHQVDLLPLDLDEAAATLADNGIDGPDLPHNPRALAAMRAADALLAELSYRRANPLDMAEVGRWFDTPRSSSPDDGAIILADESRVYLRDDTAAENEGHAITSGAWWKPGYADGDQDERPVSLGEILGLDEPACDRQYHAFERLYTASDVVKILGEYVKAQREAIDYAITEAAHPHYTEPDGGR